MAKKRTVKTKSAPNEGQALYVQDYTVETYPWPRSDEPVSLRSAAAAISLGHGPIIARYLRETKRINPLIIHCLAEQLDPRPKARLGEPKFFLTDYKIVFVKKPRGRRHSVTYNLDAIGRAIEAALGTPPNLEAAVARIREETGISRATAFRAWKGHKNHNNSRFKFRIKLD
jgi:hypothetical protein